MSDVADLRDDVQIDVNRGVTMQVGKREGEIDHKRNYTMQVC